MASLKEKSTEKRSTIFNIVSELYQKHSVHQIPQLSVANFRSVCHSNLAALGMKDGHVALTLSEGLLPVMLMMDMSATVPSEVAEQMRPSAKAIPNGEAFFDLFLERCKIAEARRNLQNKTLELRTPRTPKTPADGSSGGSAGEKGDEEDDLPPTLDLDEFLGIENKASSQDNAADLVLINNGSRKDPVAVLSQLSQYNAGSRQMAKRLTEHLELQVPIMRRIIEKSGNARAKTALEEFDRVRSGESKLENFGLKPGPADHELSFFNSAYVLYELFKYYVAGEDMRGQAAIELARSILNDTAGAAGEDAINYPLTLRRKIASLAEISPTIKFSEDERCFILVSAYERSSRPEIAKLGKDLREMSTRADRDKKSPVTYDQFTTVIQRQCNPATSKTPSKPKEEKRGKYKENSQRPLDEVANGAAAAPSPPPQPPQNPQKTFTPNGKGNGKGKGPKGTKGTGGGGNRFCRSCGQQGHYQDSEACPAYAEYKKFTEATMKKYGNPSTTQSANGAVSWQSELPE
jgi:hypothetical protein